MTTTTQKGFTLIELIIVIICLGILAVVLLPRFFSLSNEARTTSVENTVGQVLNVIDLWQKEQSTKKYVDSSHVVSGGVPGNCDSNPLDLKKCWPTAETVAVYVTNVTSESVALDNFPINPFQSSNKIKVEKWKQPCMSGDPGEEGWHYNETTGEFWANNSGITGMDGVWCISRAYGPGFSNGKPPWAPGPPPWAPGPP